MMVRYINYRRYETLEVSTLRVRAMGLVIRPRKYVHLPVCDFGVIVQLAQDSSTHSQVQRRFKYCMNRHGVIL